MGQIIVQAVEQAKATGMYVVVRVPAKFLGKLLEFEERHEREAKEN
jgi:hypothetical protein